MDYPESVEPYLNTNGELDQGIETFLGHWQAENLDMGSATNAFVWLSTASPNIKDLNSYLSHSLLVSRVCGEAGERISRNYGDIVDVSRLQFMGLAEDFFYLIGGNGQNNPNGEDSNPYHEILTDILLRHAGLDNLADGMALHFVAPEILAAEHAKGRFEEVQMPEGLNINLDIVTAVDALCTVEYLPAGEGSVVRGFESRVHDITARRGSDHPLVQGLNNGGKERLASYVERFDNLMNGRYSHNEMNALYCQAA